MKKGFCSIVQVLLPPFIFLFVLISITTVAFGQSKSVGVSTNGDGTFTSIAGFGAVAITSRQVCCSVILWVEGVLAGLP